MHGCRLLPVIIEHTIDERSPLIGHTFDTLVAVSRPCVIVTVRLPMTLPSDLGFA